MVRVMVNEELHDALAEALRACRHRLFIATADLKDVHLPSAGGRRARSIVEMLDGLGRGGIEVRVLHSGIPSGPFREQLGRRKLTNVAIRRCVRVHAKVVLVDGVRMYLGSANLTGAGLGAKSPRRRNFEAGIWTDQLELIDPVADMLDSIWNGARCESCGRRDVCHVPLEEPPPRPVSRSATRTIGRGSRIVDYGMRNAAGA